MADRHTRLAPLWSHWLNSASSIFPRGLKEPNKLECPGHGEEGLLGHEMPGSSLPYSLLRSCTSAFNPERGCWGHSGTDNSLGGQMRE